MRSIDADALEKKLHEFALDEWNQRATTSWSNAFLECEDIVYNEQTVDAIEVVRCKDCKWGVDYYHEGDCYCSNPKWGLKYFGGSWEFYCADGERREDGRR